MSHPSYCKSLLAIACGLLLLNPGLALADLSASVQAYPASQVALSGAVRIGTVVTAFTNLNSVWASVSYRIECANANVRPAPYGEQSGSNNSIFGPRFISLTAPHSYPAEIALPGWSTVKGGSSFDCVQYFTGAAKSNPLPIGAGGATFPLGGDSWSESSSLVFDVVKPGTSGTGGCIP